MIQRVTNRRRILNFHKGKIEYMKTFSTLLVIRKMKIEITNHYKNTNMQKVRYYQLLVKM